ncbi:hypothetical protein MJO28_003984 [Puccinia striiformis f. sp. tritici]|uniref:Uncharacterized protein n=3 Tax=Puccinia striiformis TaxID=27350 RepID=A0A0L0VQU8_9BASI|nr:hypothetical protein Pst134EA_007394 [Puccinia striiformis f. sp. tritici]KAI9627120.1 hypothetical protein KEM48_010029 [Puccinia striiformis f. sp. tritici PST-130]KNF01385.1 hypothetical protein PSTG_05483 [Puccinia striiformis f. sp. tritici PST-78]POW19860.1 hypothetical protein PSHT_04177 [Puccinia striiformis]KAH9460344.1 hypothetical protein Pst134EB_008522 [Puccinia striiformis f. sp. tritici]KAH9470128.1 hypothetical protein Pst134EA_007394 [Puccinia striiformis f. sp. tritici]
MKWQTLLQPSHPSCQPVISSDSKLCFLAGLPLSIHVYSTQSSLQISSLIIPDPAQKSRLVKIISHPTSPQQLLILVSSSGHIYLYDFIENVIKATYQTNLAITHAVIRSSLRPSGPSDQSNSSFTLLLVTKQTPAETKKPKGKRPALGARDKTRERSVVYAIKIDQPSSLNQKTQPIQHKIRLLKIDPVSAFSSSPCGNWIGLVTGLNIWIIRLKPIDLFDKVEDQELSKKTRFETLHLSAPEPITCIAFPAKTHADHFDSSQPPSIDVSCVPSDFFATGSSSGKIALWHALSEAQWTTFSESATRTPGVGLPCPTSVSHWHSHPVADLTFTRNGSHLLSGGEEAVLVLWRLEDFSGIGLDSKTFLPRLGTPISNISLIEKVDINEPGALVTGLDGSLMIVNVATMSLSKTLKLPKMYQLPKVYKHPRSQAILSPISSPGSSSKSYGNLLLQSSHSCGLQILDGGSGRVLSEIFVRPKNTVSRRGERAIVEPKLLFAELGGVGDQYLVTIDSWVDHDRGFSLEITLKLWERVLGREGNSDGFQVIARIENPHDDSPITSLKLSTDLIPKIITTSIDGTIKIWTSSSISPHLITVPTAITSMTTSLPKSKKLQSSFASSSIGNEFENLKSIKLKLKNYGVSQSRISKDNSIFILLHNNNKNNSNHQPSSSTSSCRNMIISIWDLKNYQFLKSFNLNSFGSISHRQPEQFFIKDLLFIGDKHQFIFILGNFGCGLFDLLTGSEIGFWLCKPKFMVKTSDESKVMVIHEKSLGREEEENTLAKKMADEVETGEGEKKPKEIKKKKINMLAIIDINTKKTILNHKLNHSPYSGRFINTSKQVNSNLNKKDSSKKDEIMDGLVLITETSGLIRAGEAIDDTEQNSIDGANRIEQALGISTQLPFQDIFETHTKLDQSRLLDTLNLQENQNNDSTSQELDFEFERLIQISPHLIPPSRLLWSSLIKPSKPSFITPIKTNPSSTLINSHSYQDHSTCSPTTTTTDSDSKHSLHHRIHISQFNHLLLSNLNLNSQLEPLQLAEDQLST